MTRGILVRPRHDCPTNALHGVERHEAVAKVLTDSYVKLLRPTPGQKGWREISDAGSRGLHMKLSPTGDKVWAIRHVVGGRRRRHIIGGYPTISLSEARSRASNYLSGTRDGMTAAETDARSRGMKMTVAEAHKNYLEAMATSLRATTIELKRGMFRLHLDDGIGSRQIRTIRKSDIIERVVEIRRDSPIQANRVFSEIMALLRWCEQMGFIDGIPSIRKRSIATKESPRRRVLTDPEIVEVWNTAGDIGDLTRDFIRLLILTGQRRDEVRNMAWSEIDMGSKLWTIPATRYKTSVDHSVPLSDAAMEIIRRRWTENATGYVLENPRMQTAYNGAASAMRRLRQKLSGQTHFTIHDIRRTVRTGLARLRVDAQVAEKILGHALPGMSRVYDLYDRLEDQRVALQKWADHVTAHLQTQSRAPQLKAA